MLAVASLTCVWVAVDHTHAHPIAKIKTATDFTLILLSVSSANRVMSKKHLKQSFSYIFTHSQPLNEMFIFNGKSCCCNGTFAVFYMATNKEYLIKKTNYFQTCRFIISSAILAEIFIQIC